MIWHQLVPLSGVSEQTSFGCRLYFLALLMEDASERPLVCNRPWRCPIPLGTAKRTDSNVDPVLGEP
jgi:hypothetical protein